MLRQRTQKIRDQMVRIARLLQIEGETTGKCKASKNLTMIKLIICRLTEIITTSTIPSNWHGETMEDSQKISRLKLWRIIVVNTVLA